MVPGGWSLLPSIFFNGVIALVLFLVVIAGLAFGRYGTDKGWAGLVVGFIICSYLISGLSFAVLEVQHPGQPNIISPPSPTTTIAVVSQSQETYSTPVNNCTSFIANIGISAINFTLSDDGNLSFYVHDYSNNEVFLTKLGVVPYNISISAQSVRFVNLTGTGEPATHPPTFSVGFAPPGGFSNSVVFGGACYIAVPVTVP